MQKRMILLLVVLSLAFTGCGETAAGEAITDEVQILVYTDASPSTAWVLHVGKDGVFTTYRGERMDVTAESFFDLNAGTLQCGQRKLTEKQIGILNDEIARFKQLEELEITSYDDPYSTPYTAPSAMYMVFLQGERFSFYDGEEDFAPYLDFVDVFIAFSPLEFPKEDYCEVT